MPKTLSAGVRFLLGLISFLLCILLFVSAIATILISDSLVVLTSQDNLKKLITMVLSRDLPRPMPRSFSAEGGAPGAYPIVIKKMALPNLRLEEADEQTGDALVLWVYEALSEQYGDEMNVTLETVQDFVEQSSLKDFVAEKGASLISDFYTGENTTTLTDDEIRNQLEENADLIEEVFGVEVTTEAITEITATITENDYLAQIQEEGIVNVVMGSTASKPDSSNPGDPQDPANPESTGNSLQEALDLFRQIASMQTLLICIGICLLLIALLFVTNMKQVWVAMKDTGITLLLAGLFFLIPTVLIWTLPTSWMTELGELRVVGVLAREILIMTSPICIGVAGLAVLLIVSGIITKCVIRKKGATAVAVAKAAPVVVEVPVVEEPVVEEPVVEKPVVAEPVVEEAPAKTEEAAVAEDAPESV